MFDIPPERLEQLGRSVACGEIGFYVFGGAAFLMTSLALFITVRRENGLTVWDAASVTFGLKQVQTSQKADRIHLLRVLSVIAIGLLTLVICVYTHLFAMVPEATPHASAGRNRTL